MPLHTHQAEELEWKALIMSNVGKNMEQLELSHVTATGQNGYNHFEKEFDSFLKCIHVFTTPYLPKKNQENKCP